MRRKKGQSTLEYVIIFAVVIAAILFSAPAIRARVNGWMQNVGTSIERSSAILPGVGQ